MEPGTVTSVFYEDGVVACNVRAVRMNTQYEGVPVAKSHGSLIEVPNQGDKVLLDQVGNERFVVGVLRRADGAPSDVAEGEIRIQLDDETAVAFSKNNDGSHDVNISASGDVNIDASGSVYVNGKEQ